MTDEQTADQLADLFWRDGSHQSIRTAIVRALQAAREEGKRSSFDSTNPPDPKPLVWLNGKKVAPAGHIIDDQGVVRRVLRPLMHTLDGAIVQDGDWVFHGGSKWLVSNGKIPVAQALQSCGAFCGYRDIGADECYSTREAAEAAKEAK